MSIILYNRSYKKNSLQDPAPKLQQPLKGIQPLPPAPENQKGLFALNSIIEIARMGASIYGEINKDKENVLLEDSKFLLHQQTLEAEQAYKATKVGKNGINADIDFMRSSVSIGAKILKEFQGNPESKKALEEYAKNYTFEAASRGMTYSNIQRANIKDKIFTANEQVYYKSLVENFDQPEIIIKLTKAKKSKCQELQTAIGRQDYSLFRYFISLLPART